MDEQRVQKATREDYFRFLREVLQAEVDSNSDPQVVYPLLAQHQEKLDPTFAEIIKQWFESELDPNNSKKNQALARTLVSFANRISEFPLGSRANNIEIAIACYQAALQVYTRKAFPEQWAMTQNNLGLAYNNRIRGERGKNLEQAIACYQAALQVCTPEAFPQNWAGTQNNLGNAYSNCIRGERGENLEKAIACYKAALQVRTPDAFPQDWATTQNNLGNTYSNRIRGERGENLEKAIACYQATLQEYTRKAFPQEWAMTQNNLGNAYLYRIRGERGENLEKAITCYKDALQVRTPKAFPEDWAMTQNNLGAAYGNRIRGERGENLEQAIACYQAALQVRTPEAFPLDCLGTGRNLGNLGFEQEDWENAIFGYDRAIRAVEQSRNWATSPQTKRQLLENALPIYGKMVQACVTLERYEQALLTVERSKSRTLSEILSQADLIPKNATPAQQQRYRQLNREIAALQQSFQGDTALGDSPDNGAGRQGQTPTTAPPQQTPLQSLLQQREKLLTEINDPDFQAIVITSPQLPDFSQLLTPTTAAIEWYLPQDPDLGAYAFILTLRDNRPHIQLHRYTPQQRQALDNFNETYFSDYRQRSWNDRLSSHLDDLTQYLDLAQLLTHIPSTCNALILIPHLYLHLFPLQALSVTREKGLKILQECFAEGVRYAPSCQILAQLQNRRQRATASQFFAIQNPTQDLPYTEVEVETIRQPFDPNSYILKNEAANKAALNSPETLAQLRQSRFIHFSCHGGFDSENPLNSALVLAGDAPPTEGDRSTLTLRDGRRFDTEHQGLTLGEIYANLELPACVLVMLSACETGLLSSKLTDEYVGLASGFLYAGSASVVSSFWCVDDFATAFLAIRFYQQLRKSPPLSIVVALQTAQNWLKTVSTSDFLHWLSNDLKLPPQQVEECELRFYRRYKTEPPFAEPKYWAGFGATGL